MKRGVEIRLDDIRYDGTEDSTRDTALTNIFVSIPQVTEVISEVEQGLEELDRMQITSIKVVYGDYGHGKSQTAHIALERIYQKETENPRLIHLENITTYRNFLHNITQAIKEQLDEIDNKEIINQLSDKFELLLDAQNTDHSLGNLTNNLIKVFKQLSVRNYDLVIFLDEVDKITHDKVDLTQWVDFFTTINDTRDLELLLMLFMPQNAADILMQADTRMTRWEQFFEMEAIYLDGQYGNDILNGIANLLALGSLYNSKELEEEDLRFSYRAFQYRKEYLTNSSIRKTNMWTFSLNEILAYGITNNMKTKVQEFRNRKQKTQAFLLKKKFEKVLNEDRLPNFEVSVDDSEDKDTFRVEYKDEELTSGGVNSNGQFIIHQRSTTSEFLAHRIGTVVEALLWEDSPQNINDIVEIAENHPTIYFTIGLSKIEEEDLQEKFDKLADKYIQYYPITIINLHRELLDPLILVPVEKDEKLDGKLKGIIKAWSTYITDHRNELEYFLQNLPQALVERTIRLKTYELMNRDKDLPTMEPLVQKQSDKPGDEAASVLDTLESDPVIGKQEEEDKEDPLVEAGKFFGASMVAIIDTIKSYKYQNTIEKELKKVLSKSGHREYKNALFNQMNKFLDILQENMLIEFDSRGGKRIIRKTNSWDDENAIQHINKQLER